MTFLEYLRRQRVHLLAILSLLIVLYWQVVPDMVQQWSKDENYSHGFLVPLIAGYFLWQRWPELKERSVRPDLVGLFVVAAGLLQLLLGWLATEYFTMRSSLVVLLAGIVLLLFGRSIAKGMALPLGYLIFMVPIPYIVYNLAAFPLKMFVTKVSVAAMHLLGVVVQREGNILIFPAITLEVADACSGIRSLLSLLALGVAYAFFVQTSTARRWIIILSSIPIAIATNALRVIVTGILAQWWGAKAAEGFFHEFAGMAVFVLAMAMLAGVGAVLKKGEGETGGRGDGGKEGTGERGDGEKRQYSSDSSRVLVTPLPRYRIASLYGLLIAAALFINLHSSTVVPTNKPFSQFPVQVGGWQMSSQQEFSANVLNVLRPTDYISREYKNAQGAEVGLYVGYHGGGKDGGEIHSPKHCLPGSGWLEMSSQLDTLQTPQGPVKLVRSIYSKGDSRQMFLYWFQVRDSMVTNEYMLKLTEIINSILYRRKDASFVRISFDMDRNETQAIAHGESFVRDLLPVLREFLPR